jgi:hypothetical protein
MSYEDHPVRNTVLLSVLGFLALMLIIFISTGFDLAQYAFWAPKYKAVERQVYQQTPSYINGNLADLRNAADQIRREKDAESKSTEAAALRDKINHLPPDFPVPADVKDAANSN